MDELTFGWEEVVFFVTLASFFIGGMWQLASLQRTIANGEKRNNEQHLEIMRYLREREKQVDSNIKGEMEGIHKHLREDAKAHNEDHDKIADRLTTAIAELRATKK